MNCLLLLIILFCCNGTGNGACGGNGCGRRGCDAGCNRRGCDDGCNLRRQNACTENCNVRREESFERTQVRKECDCDMESRMHSHTTQTMPRTQFPYLDVEPRTCGCEEKTES